MPNYILYHAITPDAINECRYSLLKYLSVYNLNPPPTIAIGIHTNMPAAFESFIPFFERFDLKPYDNTKPGKIDLIKDFLSSKFCNLLYMNTDSYPTGPVDSIFQEILKRDLVFLKKKTILNNNDIQLFQKIKTYLANNDIRVDEEKITYPTNKDFYAAEIIGVNRESATVFPKIFQLYLQLLTEVPASVAEEFAFAYYSGDKSVTINNSIFSYRNFPGFKKILNLFFEKNQEESISNLVKMVYHLDAQTIWQEKNRYDSQPFVKKILSSLSGKAWSIRQYQNKF